MDFGEPFGRWLQQRRKEHDLTQAELAQQIGCARITVQKIELGERRPSRQVVERLASVLSIAPEERERFARWARTGPGPAGASARPPRAMSLPLIAATPLVGRTAELASLAALLAAPACRLITLLGPGGVGKTRLALAALASHASAFADGAAFVPLAEIASAAELPGAIAASLHIRIDGGAPLLTQLLAALRERSLLLVLDNLEHLLDGGETLLTLMQSAPGVRLIATSRERLHLPGEWIIDLGGLEVPAEDAADGGADTDAMQLFVQRARQVLYTFTLAAPDVAAVAQVCRLVEGMPLGIELAAAWVRVLPCAEIARELGRTSDLLATADPGLVARHRSLDTAIAHSWALLGDDERRVLRALAVFRGGCTREAAQEVAGASLSQLFALCDKSLLRQVAPGRYAMHELIRHYAFRQLEAAGEANSLQERHLRYFLTLAEAAEPQLFGHDQARWLDRLRPEQSNFAAALSGGDASPDASLMRLRLAATLGPFWDRTNASHDGQRWLMHLLGGRGDAEPSAACAKALYYAGLYAARKGEMGAARALYAECLQESVSANDRRSRAYALHGLGHASAYQGDYSKAIALYEESLALLRVEDDQRGIAFTLGRFAEALEGIGQFERALHLAQESLSLYRAIGHREGAAGIMARLGGVAQRRGDHAVAIAWFEQAVASYRALGWPGDFVFTACKYSELLIRRGSYERAAALLEECLPVCEARGFRAGMAWLHWLLGYSALWQATYTLAATHYQRSFALYQEEGRGGQMAWALRGLAEVALWQGAHQRAAELYGECLKLYRESGDRRGMADALHGLGSVAIAQGDYELAQQHFVERLASDRARNAPDGTCWALTRLALLAHLRGDDAASQSYLHESLERCVDVGGRESDAAALEALAAIDVVSRPDQATRLLSAAENFRVVNGVRREFVDTIAHEYVLKTARQHLASALFARAWAEGQLLPGPQALRDALDGRGYSNQSPHAPSEGPIIAGAGKGSGLR
jgi:predicted ATPase/transcriptional regulator with XRE-family HTH domain